jgi:hypothetical protein
MEDQLRRPDFEAGLMFGENAVDELGIQNMYVVAFQGSAAIIKSLDEQRSVGCGFPHVAVKVGLCPARARAPAGDRPCRAGEIRLKGFQNAMSLALGRE